MHIVRHPVGTVVSAEDPIPLRTAVIKAAYAFISVVATANDHDYEVVYAPRVMGGLGDDLYDCVFIHRRPRVRLGGIPLWRRTEAFARIDAHLCLTNQVHASVYALDPELPQALSEILRDHVAHLCVAKVEVRHQPN